MFNKKGYRSIFRLLSVSILFVAGFLLSGNQPAHATPMNDPFGYFNAYSLGNISYSGSDFEGKAGAAGDVALNGFSLALKDQGGYALHAGGRVTLTNGSFYGGVEAGRDISVGGVGVYGDLYGGGNISNTAGGTIKGHVYAAGTATLTNSIIYYSKNSGVPYSPEADLAAISTYFADFSTMVGGMSNTGVIGSSYGSLSILANSGLNVFSLSAADMYNAHTVNITGGSDAVVYINVTGTAANLNSTTWKYYGGIAPDDVLLNYANASALTMTSSNNVNILAPFASTTFNGGLVTGNLIVGNLSGNGQVNLGHFDHGPDAAPVPEPATALLLGMGLVVLIGLTVYPPARFPQ